MLRKVRDHQCTECGAPAPPAGLSRCLAHLVRARERTRLRRGLVRRYTHSISYLLQNSEALNK